ncbi:extracellular solute-binding protein [Pseudohalocynthiibacter aestuariivivens]|nr:extracellular solute-binding protein [Pseudohalocynthiibacter aestuariivivens]QIE44210.1 extracellular solute-binding protein [Pseudohalocynthiibacter aestuariivivens]
MNWTRRALLKSSAATSAACCLGLSVPARPAWAADATITAVEWGGRYHENMQAASDTQDDIDVVWELHTGGAAAILAKIKSTWPSVNYDVVAAYSPVFASMIREDWVETVTAEQMPNLADIPDGLFMTDKAGNKKAIPRTTTALHWGYRRDLCPFEITKVEDLLDPRLAGQIFFPAPVLNSNAQMISIARALGGDENNMEPAWEFVAELAKSGNIGRVTTSGSDDFNTLSTGETSVGFGATSVFERVNAVVPQVEYLHKMPDESGFKSIIVMEGWAILKGGNTEAAMKWVNAMLSAEVNQAFNAGIGAVPSNLKANVAKEIENVRFSQEELELYTYAPDWGFVSANLSEWAQRWEREIAPLL